MKKKLLSMLFGYLPGRLSYSAHSPMSAKPPHRRKSQAKGLFYYGSTLGVYNTFWIALIFFIIFFFLLSKTRTGRLTPWLIKVAAIMALIPTIVPMDKSIFPVIKI